jgi:hypothetical protein
MPVLPNSAAHGPAHLLEIVQTLERKGVALRVLDLSIDTSTATGACWSP